MGKVSYLAAQVAATPTYNWSFIDPTIGQLDIGLVSTDAPGPGPVATGLQNVATSVLPRPIFQPQLGQISRAWEPTLGFGEFIYLAIPTSTAIPLGRLVSWAFGTSPYTAVLVPVAGTSKNTGAPVAVCIASTVQNSGAGITSNATQVQYAWFQIGGNVQTFKTAIQVAPVTTEQGAGVYVSATIAAIKAVASTGQQILGARLANQTTISTVNSLVLVYLNGRPAIEGF